MTPLQLLSPDLTPFLVSAMFRVGTRYDRWAIHTPAMEALHDDSARPFSNLNTGPSGINFPWPYMIPQDKHTLYYASQHAPPNYRGSKAPSTRTHGAPWVHSAYLVLRSIRRPALLSGRYPLGDTHLLVTVLLQIDN